MAKNLLAFDFGASSGRAMIGSFDGDRLTLKEAHRFSNDPVMLGNTFYWDFPRLFFEVKQGISAASRETGGALSGIGVDTWGVDFGLLNKNGRLLDLPVHYRDMRNAGMVDKAAEVVSRGEMYDRTGIQFMDFNSLFQLYWLQQNDPAILQQADSMLFMPDLFNYFLSGEKVSEYSIASTSQMLNAFTRNWDRELLGKLGIPDGMLKNIVQPGTLLGTLTPALCEELGVPAFGVTAVTGHDTASAVASVPAKPGENWAYLSCGTWSLLGLELPAPLINAGSKAANFTNEGGYNKSTRFLKNIIGLWLMQESRRQWIRESGALKFSDIDVWTAAAKPLQRFIDPDYPEFAFPGNMPKKIASYLEKTRQPAPEGRGDISRLITESLALKYRESIDNLEAVSGRKIDVLHIIGGGVQDRLLCEFTANATGRTVVAGPIEATAAGNLLTQLLAQGDFASLDEARACVARSFPLKVYEPADRASWEAAYDTYRTVTARAQ